MTDRTTVPDPNQLRQARATLRKTQATMAKILGVTYATYNRWENGQTTPAPDRREKLWRLIDLAAKQEDRE